MAVLRAPKRPLTACEIGAELHLSINELAGSNGTVRIILPRAAVDAELAARDTRDHLNIPGLGLRRTAGEPK